MHTTIRDIQQMRDRGERIPMVTAYDYTSAQIADRAGIPLILVGDSLGMVVLGYNSTVPVTLDDMIHHTRAVVRGTQKALVIGDLPFLTYTSPEQAMQSARRMLQEAGAQAVKLEGGVAIAPTIARLVQAGIPVMGHIGFTPQAVNQIGLRVQGRRASEAKRLLADALAVQEAGAFAIVLELVPAELAEAITERLRIPTIGIGAGAGCSGQVQVWHDMLGLYSDFLPRHARRYADLATIIAEALRQYASDVRNGAFPGPEHSSRMDPAELAAALGSEGQATE
ncbi:3-methyl-2-oxobutanoate hydroxymethyltransferase [Chloroflexus sp.]|uniref:3-methyl-2-oxobutanoate hydroxymethyltransferase n=1 Tax=Chloroflexus sp. TaxID=1904827 RepID=UPI002ADD5E39|nr:3-methyl-2-oxobutanoate hydroxymethyltransferase [Chloroflexus sp.]